MINLYLIEKRRWYFLISGILILLSAAALIVSASLSNLPLLLDEATISPEMLRAAGFAIPIMALAAMIFVWWNLRHTPNAFRYAACTITVIAHNLLVLLGFRALMGLVAGWQVDVLFFVACLAILALSAQNTVATFDRIQQNAARRKESMDTIIGRSALEILTPVLATRLCLLFLLIALALVGGSTLLPFAITLLVGVLCESYTAIFVTMPLLSI